MRRLLALTIPTPAGWTSSTSALLPTATANDIQTLSLDQIRHYFVETRISCASRNPNRAHDNNKGTTTAIPKPRSSPEPAVKNIAKDMFGNPYDYKTSSNNNSYSTGSIDMFDGRGGGGTVGGNFAGLNIDTLPLGIVIPWQDVQRQLQMFVSASITDPKSASRGRTFLRDFDVLSNISTIDEGIELLYYLQRLSYPSDSKLEKNLVAWFADNSACFTVQHVTDICKYALEQAATKAPLFWKKTILLADWFVGQLQMLVETDANLHVLLLMESTNVDVDSSENDHVDGSRGSDNSNKAVRPLSLSMRSPGAVCTLEDCVLIARVINFTAAGECSRVGDGGSRNGSKGRGGSDKQGDIKSSITSGNSATAAAIDMEYAKKRPILQALVEKTKLILEFEMECAARYKGSANDSISKNVALKDDNQYDFFAAGNDILNNVNGADVSTIPQEYILTPEKVANVVMHIAPVERSATTEALIGSLTPIFKEAKSTDALRLLTAMSDVGVCNPKLLDALCSGITKRLTKKDPIEKESKKDVKIQKNNKNKPSVNLKQLREMERDACSREEKKDIDETFNLTIDILYASKALQLLKLITSTELNSVIHAIEIIKTNKQNDAAVVPSTTSDVTEKGNKSLSEKKGKVGSADSNTLSTDTVNSIISPVAAECLRVLSSLVEAISTSTQQEIERVIRKKGMTPSNANQKNGSSSQESPTSAESESDEKYDYFLNALCEVSDAINVGHTVLFSQVAELLPESTSVKQSANKSKNGTSVKKLNNGRNKSSTDFTLNSDASPSSSSSIATIQHSCYIINKGLTDVVRYVISKDPVDLRSFGACLRIAARLQSCDPFLYTMLSNACVNISDKAYEQSFTSSPNGELKGSSLGDLSFSFESAVSIAEGLCAFQCFPPTLVEVCVRQALEQRSRLTSHNIACLIYIAGSARGAQLDVEVYHQLTSRLINTAKFTSRSPVMGGNVHLSPSATLSPNSVAMLLKGLASADIKPDEMLQQYLGQQPLLFANDFSGKDCTSLLTVVHQLKLESSPLGQRLGSEIAEAIPRMIPDDLVLIASTMAQLNLRDVRLFDQIGGRLRDLSAIVSSSHLTAFAAALRATNFASVFTNCELERVVRSLTFLSPNDATYLTAFCSPATQDYLLNTFIKSIDDLKQLSVESLLTVYSTEGRASDSIQSDALLLLEGKVSPVTLPADVACKALCRSIKSSNNSDEEMRCVSLLIEFVAPVAHKFLQSHVTNLLESLRDCIRNSVSPQQLASNILAEKGRLATVGVDNNIANNNNKVTMSFLDEVESSTNTLKGATFRIPIPVYRFLGRRLVAISESLSVEQCIMALEIYRHGNVRDDSVVKPVFKRLTKHTRIISSSTRLSIMCLRLCEFFGPAWTHGLNVSLKVKAAKKESSKRF